MDTKTVGMAVSVSAIGAALAYLGLNNYNDSVVKNEPIDVTENINLESEKESKKNSEKELEQDSDKPVENLNQITKEFSNEEELKEDEDKIKNEIKEVIQKEAWGKFWKTEYESVDKNDTIKPGINAEGF